MCELKNMLPIILQTKKIVMVSYEDILTLNLLQYYFNRTVLFVCLFVCLQSFSCGILVPLPGIEPRPLVVKALSHNL